MPGQPEVVKRWTGMRRCGDFGYVCLGLNPSPGAYGADLSYRGEVKNAPRCRRSTSSQRGEVDFERSEMSGEGVQNAMKTFSHSQHEDERENR